MRYILVLAFAIVMEGTSAHAGFNVGNIDGSMAIERVTVSDDGRLFAWDKGGKVVPGWPKDLTQDKRYFSYGPRMADVDLDLKQEIIAVSEKKDGGALKMHVYKGNGAELTNWSFSIPDSKLLETPIISDVNHDSSLEVVYATAGNRARVFRRDFQSISDFTKDMASAPHLSVGDHDNDGMDNLFASVGGAIYIWDENGASSAFYNLPGGEEVIGSVVFKDLARDGQPELIFGTSGGRIMAIDQNGANVLAIKVPAGAHIISPVIVDDIDIDKSPELLVVTDNQDVLAFETTGELLSSWNYQLDYREPPPVSGVIANDIYRGLFSSVTGIDQNSIYKTKHNSYSRIKLGSNVREWDTFANFDFLEMIEVFDLFTWPNPFTPNGDGVNDLSYIHYRLSDDALVAVDLYDSHERFISRVREKVFEKAGEHQTPWSGVDTRATRSSLWLAIAIFMERHGTTSSAGSMV